MILTVEELMSLPEFQGQDEDTLIQKLLAVEEMVRSYTHNNFQNRNIRFEASSWNNVLEGASPFLKEGDTVQVTESGVNDGLYVVAGVDLNNERVEVDKTLWKVRHNLVTKVEYPFDVKMGVVNLMKWEVTNRDKVGIKQETLSRHSVTYYDQDSTNTVMGYPVSLMAFLKPYIKARF